MELREAYDPFRALGGAWKLVQRAPLPLALGGLLLFATDPDPTRGVSFEQGHLGLGEALITAGVLAPCFCFGILIWVVNTFLHLGMAEAVRVAVRGEVPVVGELFRRRELFPALLLARLLKFGLCLLVSLPFPVLFYGPVLAGQWLDLDLGLADSSQAGFVMGALCALAYLPIWGYVLLGLVLVEEAVAFEGKAPLEALRRSWELASGGRLSLLLYGFVLALLTVLGLCILCVGWIAVGAWCQVAWFESYARLSAAAGPSAR